MQFGAVTFIGDNFLDYFRLKIISGHNGLHALFAYNFLQTLDRAMRLISMYPACQGVSIDVHNDLVWPTLGMKIAI